MELLIPVLVFFGSLCAWFLYKWIKTGEALALLKAKTSVVSLSSEPDEILNLLQQLGESINKPTYIPVEGPPTVIEKHIPAPIDIPRLENAIKEIPGQVVRSIIGSTNYQKGALGELIAYLQLSSEYDRIICLGNIVDYICIKFPSDTSVGQIDFIDIKTGKSARPSKDQLKLKSLITDKKVNFKVIKIASSEYAEETSNEDLLEISKDTPIEVSNT